MLTAKISESGVSQTPFNILFGSAFGHGEVEGEGEGEEEVGEMSGEGVEGEEGEEEEEEEEGVGEREEVQLEVISDSISQTADAPVWQLSVNPSTINTTATSVCS